MSAERQAAAPQYPALAGLRGELPTGTHASRDTLRPASNLDCHVLPAFAAMGVTADTVAQALHTVGLGPDPRAEMSQNARLQGDTFDRNMHTDGRPLIEALQAAGWLTTAAIAVINVDDHVSPPGPRTVAAGDGKGAESDAWRINLRRRARHTRRFVTEALRRDRPTLILRGVVETSEFAGTPVRAFGEFDFALVLPAGWPPADPGVLAETTVGAANPGGLIIVGDGKSWRRRQRLVDGDKRAAAAAQVALYVAAARSTWDAEAAAAVCSVGLVANPPAAGGLGKAHLTRVDLSDALAKTTVLQRMAADAAGTVERDVAAAVAAGARFDPQHDPAATRSAAGALLAHSAWNPSCLSACPLGQACRRRLADSGDVARLGDLAAQAAPVTTIGRLEQLRTGQVAPTGTETGVAETLQRVTARFGTRTPLPWPQRAGGQEEVA